MWLNLESIEIFIKPGATDMRKQAGGLAEVIQEELGANPFSGNLYLFCNRRRNLVKAVYWDRNGYCCWSKRLEADTFSWPKDAQEVLNICSQQLRLLLRGIDIWREHKEIFFEEVC
jgi:transposase